MESKLLKDVANGEFFKRKPDSNKVYLKEGYQRDSKKYQCNDCFDIWGNGLLLKGSTIVYVGFTY